MSYPGIFIAIEGPECSGKTSVSTEVAKRLELKGYTVRLLLSHHDGEERLAYKQRQLILDPYLGARMSDTTRALCFAAARRDLIENTILPALSDGQVVIVDRWVMSTLAIQRDCENVDELNMIATAGVVPDYTFILDLPIKETMSRLSKRPGQQDILDMVSGAEHQARLDVYHGTYSDGIDKYLTYLETDRFDRDWVKVLVNTFIHTQHEVADIIFNRLMEDRILISAF